MNNDGSHNSGSAKHAITPLLIEGGRAVIETERGEGQDGVYVSIRIAADRDKVMTLLEMATPVLEEVVRGSTQ